MNTYSTHILRVSTEHPPVREDCRVVVEQPLTIAIEDVGDYTLMCTPSDAMALAVGFAFTEGIISDAGEIDLLRRCEDDPNTVQMRLSGKRVGDSARARTLIVASSCGIGRIEDVLEGLPVCQHSLVAPLSMLLSVQNEMKSRQIIFRDTGGAHAAAIFASDGEITAFAEDIGRHNALDKAIGKCLLSGTPAAGCVASPRRVFFTIALPMAWRSILSGMILMWARGFAVVYQDCALFPHMSVAQNIGYGLKSRAKAQQRLPQIVKSLGI